MTATTTATVPHGERFSDTTTFRKTGIAIGLLFIVATVTFMAGHTMVLEVLGGDSPIGGSAAAHALTTGALLLFADALAVVAIGFLFYPVLKGHGEALALSYAGLRVAELAAILLLMAPVLLLVLPSVASTPDRLAVTTIGVDASASLVVVARAQYRAAMALVFVCVAVSGLVLSWGLIRSRLVAQAIGWLGLVGYGALLAGTVLDLFGIVDLQGAAAMLAWPVGIFENLALPGWLFVKGFIPGETR